ncbi:cytochrome P450 [Irpex rosettiformis]|uniref:Cytochrome P450 n=1 Tax=Irpex rosettiformis TaxID=378272 RepID=A0ACB8TP50_9APHY|nr:cytochrome P450 [Irpex rosettiformis]
MSIHRPFLQNIRDYASWTTIAFTVIAGAVIVPCYKGVLFAIRNFTSPLHALPGPPSTHFFWGVMKDIFKVEHSVLQEQWMDQYGPTISYTGMLGIPRLWTVDPRAINHILTNSYAYQKTSESRFVLARVVGPGLLVAEEDQHKHQRRVLNPAFGPVQVREFTEVFVEKSKELRDRWLSVIAKSGTEQVELDGLSWLSKATLDIIGLTGFGYDFDSLNPEGNQDELSEAFHASLKISTFSAVIGFLQAFVPLLRIFKTKNQRLIEEAQRVMRRIGMQLIAEKKASILGTGEQKKIGRKDVVGRDLLTLLIKANMATDIPESQRLTDEEVLAQVPTFIVAGHETTSTGTMWTLFSLTQHPEVQRKLREELLTVTTETPTMEQLQALPYLDMVVKESLRYHAPVPMTVRTAINDDIIPCSMTYTDRHGVRRDHIPVAKGDIIIIPILAMNRYKQFWGEDAKEFRPERWENTPEAINSIPGVYGNIISFIGGPRSCIGYRFSLIEMKALLFVLVRSFEFELAVPADKIKKKTAIVQRPIVVGDEKEEPKMPLLIKAYVRA